MSKVLLIGSNGLLGKCIKSRLVEGGYFVTSVSRSNGFDIGMKENFISLGYDYDYVLNLAAIVQVSVENVEEAIRVNGIGALNAAEFSFKAGAMYIYASTISALHGFDDYSGSYYAISKRLGEELVNRYFDDKEVNSAVLRFPQLYDSSCEAEKYQPMLYRIARQLKYDKCATLYGESNPLRNYLHIDDAASAIILSMKEQGRGEWNCIHPVSIDLEGLIGVFSEMMGTPVCINRLKDKDDIPDLEIPGHDLFHKSHSGWKPRELSAGLKDIVASV